MDRRAWRATVHRVTKSWTQLSNETTTSTTTIWLLDYSLYTWNKLLYRLSSLFWKRSFSHIPSAQFLCRQCDPKPNISQLVLVVNRPKLSLFFFFFLQTVVGKLKQSSQFLFGGWNKMWCLETGDTMLTAILAGGCLLLVWGERTEKEGDGRVGRHRDSQPNRERQEGQGWWLQREQTKRILKPQDCGPCLAWDGAHSSTWVPRKSSLKIPPFA